MKPHDHLDNEMTSEKNRIEAFSDGVFAIAITLLILELKVPLGLSAHELIAHLIDDWPSYFAFAISFISIGIMWLNHHRLFSLIKNVDHKLLIYNGLLLFAITVVPFPTSLVAGYLGHEGEVVATAIYTTWGLIIALAFTLVWRHATNPHHNHLLVHKNDPIVTAINKQYRIGPIAYLITIGFSFINPTIALVMCFILFIYFTLSPEHFMDKKEQQSYE